MIATTQNWKDFSVDHSNYEPLIVVTKNGNIVWTFDSSNIKENSLKFTDEICDLGDFNIGATPCNHFECDIINFDNTFPSPDTFKGCKANLYFFLSPVEFGGTNAVAGQAIVGQAIVGTESTWTDFIKRGVYFLDPVNSVGRIVHLSGSDAMGLTEFNSANMEGFDFTGLTAMQAIKQMGFNLQHTFPNSDFALPSVVCSDAYGLADVTKRTMLGYIAAVCGCYARHNNTGELVLKAFSTSGTATSVTKIMQEPIRDYYPVEITGVFVSGSDAYAVEGTDGYVLYTADNPFVAASNASEIANTINTMYNGMEIVPFEISYIADPALEPGDLITFTHNGETTTSIVTSFAYGLGQLCTISADADTEEHATSESWITSETATSQKIRSLYNGDTLKKIINLSANEVQIEADNININGVISANGNFKVNTDGTIEAVNGTFNGTVNASDGKIGIWNVGADPYDRPSIYSDPYDTEFSGCKARTLMSASPMDVVDGGYTLPASSFAVDVQPLLASGTPASYYERVYYVDKLGNTHTDVSYANTFSQTSDRRAKDNIEDLKEPVTLKLRPVTFVMKNDPYKRIHHGFIAQEVQEVCGDWAVVQDGKTLSLAYTEIIADLVATVQSMHKKLEELEDKINGSN